MKKIIISFSIISALILPNALAYIDPGTAGTIIGGSIWPFIVMIGVAVGGFFVKFFWMPIKCFFVWTASPFRKKDKAE